MNSASRCWLAMAGLLATSVAVSAGPDGKPVPAARTPTSGLAAAETLHAWENGNDPALLQAWVEHRLAAADRDIRTMLDVKGARTVANTLRPFDDAENELAIAADETQLLYGVGATAPLRDKAQALVAQVAAVQTAMGLNREVYRALAAIPAPGDAVSKHYLDHILLEFRLAGVDRDDATRATVRALQDTITETGLAFERNVHDDVRKVVASKADLAGLPDDYIALHPPDADGHYIITTDPPDAGPVRSFATSAELRHKVYLAGAQVAYPANDTVLHELLQARKNLATTLGYPTFADLAMADQMMGSPAHLEVFLDQLDRASREPARKEYAALLAFAQKSDPTLTQLSVADLRYWTEQYRRSVYNFDSQSVRPYFPYAAVESGILQVAARLFHIQFKAVKNATIWDPSVTVYDVLDGGRTVGRIYLDMHPRQGKDKWFSSAGVVPGIHGRQIPEGALICNFSGGTAGDPGLMQFGEVVTFFHEFGHLMHHILGSQNAYSGIGGFNVEGDFVEAPSQMLEEFFHDRKLLALFAHHYQTGEVIPEDLVNRMNAANAFGRAGGEQRGLMYTAISYDLHTQEPSALDFDAVEQADFNRFNLASFVEGDHSWASFIHLNGYSSNYYTYALDKVIALDFFAQFDRRNLLDGPTAMRYRHSVLEPGASVPATQLVHDFLGREQNTDAYTAWMLEAFKTP